MKAIRTHMISLIAILLYAGTFAFPANSEADWQIEMEQVSLTGAPDSADLMALWRTPWSKLKSAPHAKNPHTTTIRIRNGQVRVDSSDARNRKGQYFLTYGEEFRIVDAHKKEYTTFNPQQVKKTADSMQSAVQRMMEAQIAKTHDPAAKQQLRAALEMMQNRSGVGGMPGMAGMPNAAPVSEPRVKRLARQELQVGTETIPCTLYEVTQVDGQTSQKTLGCVTQDYPELWTVMKTFSERQKKMRQKMQGNPPKDPETVLAEYGWPITVYTIVTPQLSLPRVEAQQVTKIDKTQLDSSLFDLNGFQEIDMQTRLQQQMKGAFPQ